MQKIPMTAAGFKNLDEELKRLRSVERPAVIQAIAEARAHGDLSENAEYHAAREDQSRIEGRIKHLTSVVSRAEIINVAKLSGSIKFGATVTVEDDDSGVETVYQLVSEDEASISKGLLNVNSPLARAMVGKEEGDSVEFETPGGVRSFTVLKVRYI